MRERPLTPLRYTRDTEQHETDPFFFVYLRALRVFVVAFCLTAREEAALGGDRHGLGAIVGAELVEDRGHVELDRPL